MKANITTHLGTRIPTSSQLYFGGPDSFSAGVWIYMYTYIYGQITIIPKPEFFGHLGIKKSLTITITKTPRSIANNQGGLVTTQVPPLGVFRYKSISRK